MEYSCPQVGSGGFHYYGRYDGDSCIFCGETRTAEVEEESEPTHLDALWRDGEE